MAVIPEASFFFSLATLNASFAGLGGLFVGLRRGPDLRPLEALRLRQVVEFAFANLLLAIAVPPCITLLGPDTGFRVVGGLALAYTLTAVPVLQRRVARVGISWGRWWAASAIALTLIGSVLSAATVMLPSAGLYEVLAVVMLARPMVVFVLVLGTIESEPSPGERGGLDQGGRMDQPGRMPRHHAAEARSAGR